MRSVHQRVSSFSQSCFSDPSIGLFYQFVPQFFGISRKVQENGSKVKIVDILKPIHTKNHEKESTGRIPDDGEPDTRLQAALHHGCQNWSQVAFFPSAAKYEIEGRGAPTRAGRSRLPRMQVTLGQRNPLAFPCQDLPSIEDQK